jgi:Immunity protein 8
MPPIRATIRRFHSPDVDVEAYEPADPADAGFLLQLIVGPSGGPGEESFDVTVCTPAWLGRTLLGSGPLIGRHLLIVDTIDLPRIKSFLQAQIEKLDEATWLELAAKLGRLGRWEFEDYTP